jgi:hypothetical protein
MKGIIFETNELSLYQNNNGIFYLIPIKSSEYMGKYFAFENATILFPEIFKDLNYEIVDLEPKVFEVDTTPPPLSPYAVVIPEIYQWAFPENKFVLSGFEIPLDTHNNDKVVNLAYFMWSEFRAELDSGNYVALKRSLMPLWDYVELQVINNNLVIL